MKRYEDYKFDQELKQQTQQDFSEALRFYMERDGVTQRDMVEALQLSTSTISNWVKGNRMPRQAGISMLADYFHVSEDDMRRLPAWVDFAEAGTAEIGEELLKLSRLLTTVNSVSVDGQKLPAYVAQNLLNAIKTAQDCAKELSGK